MRNYIIKFFGSIGVVPLEYERAFMSSDAAVTHLEQSLPRYHPVYWSAAAWSVDEKGETALVAEFKTVVKAERVISSSNKMTDAEIEAHDRAEYEKEKQR